MEGIRIKPVSERNVPDSAMVVVRDISRPFPAPRDGTPIQDVQPVCQHCGVQHFHKVYHLQLRAGTVIVSTVIWAKLQAMPDNGGFEFVNVVDRPPTQEIGPNQEPKLLEKVPHDISTVKLRGPILAGLIGQNTKTARAGEAL